MWFPKGRGLGVASGLSQGLSLGGIPGDLSAESDWGQHQEAGQRVQGYGSVFKTLPCMPEALVLVLPKTKRQSHSQP